MKETRPKKKDRERSSKVNGNFSLLGSLRNKKHRDWIFHSEGESKCRERGGKRPGTKIAYSWEDTSKIRGEVLLGERRGKERKHSGGWSTNDNKETLAAHWPKRGKVRKREGQPNCTLEHEDCGNGDGNAKYPKGKRETRGEAFS